MKKLAFLFLLVIASFIYFNKKELVIQPAKQPTEKKELVALPVKPIVQNKEEIAAEIKSIEHRPEIKQHPNLIKTPAGDAEKSLEQFKKENPEAIVRIEKFNEMNPGSMPTLEQFKKNNPDVTIKIETFEMSPAKK